MEIKIDQAKKLYNESPEWFKDELVRTFGKKAFEKKDYQNIKTFEDACGRLGVNSENFVNENDTTDEVAYKKLKVIAKALNNGWVPDWNNGDQYKWFPYFNLSSGFGFSGSNYYCTSAYSAVGSRLCFENEELADYAGSQFTELYKELLTITE